MEDIKNSSNSLIIKKIQVKKLNIIFHLSNCKIFLNDNIQKDEDEMIMPMHVWG